MKRVACSLGLALFLLVVNGAARAQKNFTEGPVWRVVHVRITPGKTNEFWADLNTNAKKIWEAEKAQGLILNYRVVINTSYREPNGWDVGYMIEYKDMAALDGLIAKFETLADQVAGSAEQRKEIVQKRTGFSEVVSSELVREVTLK